MSIPEPNKTPSAFDDLLDGEPSSPNAFRDIADEAKANREAAQASVKRAASHARARAEHAARVAHEKAHAVGISVRRHAPSVIECVRNELAKPIRWRVVGPIMVGSTILAGAVLAVLLAWNAHRIAMLDEQSATAGAASLPAAAPTTSDPAPTAPLVTTPPSTPTVSVVAATPVAAEPTHDVPVVAPVFPSLPPAPSEPSLANCTAAVPLLNGLFASASTARTPEEIVWAAFGYRCAQNGALTYGKAGYAPKETEKKTDGARRPLATANDNEPVRPSVRADKTTSRGRSTPAPAVAAVKPPTPTATALPAAPTSPPGMCALRGSASTTEGGALANVPVQITGLDSSRFEQRISTDGEGHFIANVPTGTRLRVVLRARGYLDDVRETLNCAPVALTGKKSNPFSSLFDAARRADRSIQGATGRR